MQPFYFVDCTRGKFHPWSSQVRLVIKQHQQVPPAYPFTHKTGGIPLFFARFNGTMPLPGYAYPAQIHSTLFSFVY